VARERRNLAQKGCEMARIILIVRELFIKSRRYLHVAEDDEALSIVVVDVFGEAEFQMKLSMWRSGHDFVALTKALTSTCSTSFTQHIAPNTIVKNYPWMLPLASVRMPMITQYLMR
jgi:hypothetical protein